MDENNMTLGDFVEFAEVYPYTQDHYMMEKMFMEMDLIGLHLESYQFLLESNNISLNQIDVLMVESGVHDKSLFTEELFIEKGGNIFNGIKKMFAMIGKAICAMFRRLSGIFKSGNSKSKALKEKNKGQMDIAKMLLDSMDEMEDLLKENDGVKKNIDILEKELEARIRQVANYYEGDIVKFKPVPSYVDHNDAIRVIFDVASKITGGKVDSSVSTLHSMLCQEEYEVEGLAIIANFESIVDEVSKVIDLSGGEEDGAKAAYASAKKLYKMGSNYSTACDKVKEVIGTACRTNKRFTMSEETLQKKLEAAEKLNKVFTNISDWTKFTNMDTKDDAINRANNDPEIKKAEGKNVIGFPGKGEFIDNDKFIKMYPLYLKSINSVATTFQSAVAIMTKALTAHIQLRESALNSHSTISDNVGKVLDFVAAKKAKDDK